MLRELAGAIEGAPAWTDFLESADALEAKMSRLDADRSTIGVHAARAAAALDRVDAGRWTAHRVAAMIARWNDPGSWKSSRAWDDAAARYLALVPLLQAWTRLDPLHQEDQARLHSQLERTLKALRYPSGFDSPRGFDPALLPIRP
jgi:hypothetical protein